MKDLRIEALATSDSGFYYWEGHEWRGLNEQMGAWFAAQLAELQRRISASGGHGGDISAVFSAVVDSAAVPSLSVSGVTRKEMSKFQRAFHNIGDELIRLGEHAADEKDRKHHGRK